MSTSRYKLLVPWFVCVSYMSAQLPASDLVFIIVLELNAMGEGKLVETGLNCEVTELRSHPRIVHNTEVRVLWELSVMRCYDLY
jgi:hypothetical protein